MHQETVGRWFIDFSKVTNMCDFEEFLRVVQSICLQYKCFDLISPKFQCLCQDSAKLMHELQKEHVLNTHDGSCPAAAA